MARYTMQQLGLQWLILEHIAGQAIPDVVAAYLSPIAARRKLGELQAALEQAE